MIDWKETLRFVDEYEGLIATVQLDFLRRKESVRVQLNDFTGNTELSPEAEAAVDALLQRLPGMEPVIMDTAFKHYQQECSFYQNNECAISGVTDAVTLLPFYQLDTIYLPDEPEDGHFGLAFNCDWEIEHGFGLRFRHWQLVEVGGEAEALQFDE